MRNTTQADQKTSGERDESLAIESAAAAVRALGAALDGAFVERRDEVRCLLAALVAREHVLLLGDPGTGKSALTQALTKALGGSYFQVLMTRFTVPEEVFGPISLVGLERDEYRRVTAGYLPSARVAFLDEVFKANSAILNALLTALNERAFDNGGQRASIPLEIVIGASNELAEDESLAALSDRFLLKRWVSPVKSRDALRRLLAQKGEPAISATLSAADLATVRAAADAVTVGDDVLDLLLDLRDELAREHGITVSDRRWRKLVKVIRAVAAIDGRTVASKHDALILADCLWSTPEERAKIVGTLSRLAAPDLAEAHKLLDAATELFASVGPLKDAPMAKGAGTKTGLTELHDELKKVLEAIRKLDQSVPAVNEATSRVQGFATETTREVRKRLGM